MMETPRDLLIFALDGLAYGVDAALVRETLWLPALSPADNAPPGIVGLFNRRGEILPVADLALCLGHAGHRCRGSDQVVVLAAAGAGIGVVASEVHEFAHLPAGALLPLPDLAGGAGNPLPVGCLQWGERMVTLLDAGRLAEAAMQAVRPAVPLQPEATAAEETLFAARARALRQPEAPAEEGRRALAVVALGEQRFGIELGAVREFCRVGQLVPIPCCPPQVAGVFARHGHLVVLLELAAALQLPPPAAPRPQAVIGVVGGQPVGLAVDAVLDVVEPGAAELQAPPAELLQQYGSDIRAVASYRGGRVAVLDLPALLARPEWAVDEAVP